MAVLPIRISGDAVLHAPALPVTAFDAELHELVANMIDTMHAAPGVGLAAPQVGVPLRLFVYEYTDSDAVVHSGAAINPVLLISPPPVADADEDTDSEGCLSFPGERFPLVRSSDAVLRAFDVDGVAFEVEASGWLARIFQHEFDHLNGYLYVDRLEFPYAKAAAKISRKRSWGSPGQSWMPGVDTFEGGA
ncbi:MULTISPECIES: peptide deformylase [Subtercola]|uniref:Peptide deformylase n=1 Tax=Subtercola vilae TaxID=2056433 RepID=A0A4T2CBR2_9MICO|nr:MULTISPECIES: peptide deformylase [Subtercola]MEA9984957.1 peptide deformylase [Subtercola sp. RTI3]TIH39908.1 peptide deformylase [Subtercola vilae]